MIKIKAEAQKEGKGRKGRVKKVTNKNI